MDKLQGLENGIASLSSSTTETDVNSAFSLSNGFGEQKPLAIALLKKTIELMDILGVTYFLISGTLLGKVRHGDLIPWDDDMDIMVSSNIISKLNLLRKIAPEMCVINKGGFLVKLCWRNNAGTIPVPPKEDLARFIEVGDNYTFPFIDLFIYNENEHWTNANGNPNPRIINFFKKNWDAAHFFPLRKTVFCGMIVNVPKNPDHFLSINYGNDYMSKLVSGDWDHRNECKRPQQITIRLINPFPYHF
jgi:hypothetical protein